MSLIKNALAVRGFELTIGIWLMLSGIKDQPTEQALPADGIK